MKEGHELQQLPTLETLCKNCNGDGDVISYRGRERCDKCNGAGYIPTEIGTKILDLMAHNFRPMLQDAI